MAIFVVLETEEIEQPNYYVRLFFEEGVVAWSYEVRDRINGTILDQESHFETKLDARIAASDFLETLLPDEEE